MPSVTPAMPAPMSMKATIMPAIATIITAATTYRQGRAGKLHHFFGGSWERSDYTDYGTPGSWLNILDDPQYTKIWLYGNCALLLDGDRLRAVAVEAGLRNWAWAEVRSGLAEGDRVVTSLDRTGVEDGALAAAEDGAR